MIYRLTNQKDTGKTLSVSVPAWFGLLEMAEAHGWNPMGTGLPPWWSDPASPHGSLGWIATDGWNGDYTAGDGGLVMLEDALNLADALERAFWAYEPEFSRTAVDPFRDYRTPAKEKFIPGIGTMSVASNFCREGAFWIERV